MIIDYEDRKLIDRPNIEINKSFFIRPFKIDNSKNNKSKSNYRR